LPKPVLRGQLEPGSGSIRDFKVVVFDNPTGDALYVTGQDFHEHPLSENDCGGRHQIVRAPYYQHCRLNGEFEVSVERRNVLAVAPFICHGKTQIPQEWMKCFRLGIMSNSRLGGLGAYILPTPSTPVHVPARVTDISPRQVYSRLFPRKIDAQQTAANLNSPQRDLVKLTVTGDIPASKRFIIYPSDPVFGSQPPTTTLGFYPLFKVRYRYDGTGSGLREEFLQWLDAGPVIWDNSQQFFLKCRANS
jgi:hypothetical protein